MLEGRRNKEEEPRRKMGGDLTAAVDKHSRRGAEDAEAEDAKTGAGRKKEQGGRTKSQEAGVRNRR